MASERELFWTHHSYAIVGHSARMPFPRLTLKGLKERNKETFAIDPSTDQVEGDRSFEDFAFLPKKVDAAILEVPADETASWVERAAQAGISRIWIHHGTESPDAILAAQKHGIKLMTGTCAVMYLTEGFSPHAIHRAIMRLLKRY